MFLHNVFLPKYARFWQNIEFDILKSSVLGPVGRTLRVNYLPLEYGDADLANLFRPFGMVERAVVVKDTAFKSVGYGTFQLHSSFSNSQYDTNVNALCLRKCDSVNRGASRAWQALHGWLPGGQHHTQSST